MISAETISELSTQIAKLIEDSQVFGMLVIDTCCMIRFASSYIETHFGGSISKDPAFISLLEDKSALPPMTPNTCFSQILRIRKDNGDVAIMRSSFFVGEEQGTVILLPMTLARDETVTIMTKTNDQLSALTRKLAQRNSELEEARQEIKTLSGLLPICAKCKKINKGNDSWEAIESYIKKRTDANFTHGYCPDCAEAMLKQLEDE
jgi:hypothetical protein